MTPEEITREVESCFAAGLSVIALRVKSKAPQWSEWTTSPPMDRAEALRWRLEEGGNLGIRTGKSAIPGGTQVIVIDVDLRHGKETTNALANLGLPDTWTVETGGGGRHFYFRHPDGKIEIGNSTSKLGKGIDVRGTGGQVVAPGSQHPNGGWYRWADERDPRTISLADLPDEISKLLGAKTPPKGQGGKANRLVREEDVEPGLDPLRTFVGVEEGQRNQVAAQLAGVALRKCPGQKDIVWQSLRKWNERCHPPLPEEELDIVFNSIVRRDQKNHPERWEDERLPIYVSDNLALAVEQIEEAMGRAYPAGHPLALYESAGTLVQVLPGRHAAIEPMNLANLRERMSGAAKFFHVGRAARGACAPPNDVVSALLRRGHWNLPELVGLRTYPYLRPSGTVAATPGYDSETKCLGIFEKWDAPLLNGKVPTREDAIRAFDKLSEPLVDFPFKGRGDLGTAIALPLTILAREAIRGDVPLWAVRSHAPGSGKGLLTKVLVTMALGSRPAMSPPCEGGEEMRKRLFSVAISGTPVFILDNEEGEFGSSALSAVLTAGIVEDRILGQSRQIRVPWRAVTVVTGNNLTFRRDQSRRTLLVDLDPKLEHPELRVHFRYPDVLSHVEDHAEEYIAAGLTLLRAHQEAGTPREMPGSFGGFESWCLVVRQALCWIAGGHDPLRNRFRIHEDSDLDQDEHGELLLAWWRTLGDQPIAARDLCKVNLPPLTDILRELTDRAPTEDIDPKALGYLLRRYNGRIAQCLRLESIRTRTGTNAWVVKQMTADPNPLG